MQALYKESQDLVESQYADSTIRQFHREFDLFTRWCNRHALRSCPPSPLTLQLYVAFLARSYKASTIRSKLSLISARLKSLGFAPVTSPLIPAVIKGKEISDADSQDRPALAILPHSVSAVSSLLERSLEGRRDLALICLGIAGFFRPGELANIHVEHIVIARDYSWIRIFLPRSKADRLGKGVWVSIDAVPGSPICAVSRLLQWLRSAGISSGPLWRRFSEDGRLINQPITTDILRLILKQRAAEMGLDSSLVNGRSLRRGGYTAAAVAGVPKTLAARHGRWSSRAMDRYFDEAGYFESRTCADFLH